MGGGIASVGSTPKKVLAEHPVFNSVCISICMSIGSLCMVLFLLNSDTSSVTESQIAKVLMDEQDVQDLLSSRIVDLLNGTGE